MGQSTLSEPLVKCFQPSILGTWLAIITLPGLRVVIDLHHPSRSRVGETLACGLPIPMRTIDMGTVAPALEENTPNDQQAIDGQVRVSRHFLFLRI